MTRYYKVIENGYIIGIGTGGGGVEITSDEYVQIMEIIKNRPAPHDGYDYRLMENLTWEQYETPVIDEDEEEISDAEALAIITGGA